MNEGDILIILNSAHKHGISEIDMLSVIAEPYVVAELRAEPEKILFLGFDSNANAIEVITDTGIDGNIFIIHANKITKAYKKLLEEALKCVMR